jgi:hypothetical protein
VSFRWFPDAAIEGLVSEVVTAARGEGDVEDAVGFTILSAGEFNPL